MDLTELNNQLNSLQFDFQNNDKMQNNDIIILIILWTKIKIYK